MGAIRGILLVFVCVFLFLSLLIGNLFLTFSMSLEHDNVKADLQGFINNLVQDKNLENSIGSEFELMQFYCKTNMEYVFEYDGSGYDLAIPCTTIMNGPNAVVSYVANDFIEDFYYKNYDCNFFDCLGKENAFFLISEKAKDYWNNKFYLMLLASAILTGLVFLLAEKKSNTFIIAGALLIVASLPFSKLDLILNFFSDKSLLALLGLFFRESYTVFVVSLVAGIVILAIGILLKIFKAGFKISGFFSKFSKKDESGKVEEKAVVKEVPKKIVSAKPVKKSKKLAKKFNFSGLFNKKKVENKSK